jgi:hypothetical protein
VSEARSSQSGSELGQLVDAAELAVTACLPLLPLRGSWGSGYEVQQPIDLVLRATHEEWANAAHHIAELHALVKALGR